MDRDTHVKTTPTRNEIDLQKRMFEEAAFMGGTQVSYQQVDTSQVTDVSSEIYKWKDPVTIDIIYDERPKVSLLKRLNWYVEDSSIQPRIMYVPSAVNGEPFKVRRGDLVKVNPDYQLDDEDTLFMISEVRTDLVALYYVCNVVPYRHPEPPSQDPTVNNKWLSV